MKKIQCPVYGFCALLVFLFIINCSGVWAALGGIDTENMTDSEIITELIERKEQINIIFKDFPGIGQQEKKAAQNLTIAMEALSTLKAHHEQARTTCGELEAELRSLHQDNRLPPEDTLAVDNCYKNHGLYAAAHRTFWERVTALRKAYNELLIQVQRNKVLAKSLQKELDYINTLLSAYEKRTPGTPNNDSTVVTPSG